MDAITQQSSEPASERSPRLDDSLDEEIVSAAAALLAEVGYDAMSMDKVAARAGVGKATIYRRWSGKPALVLDTVRARGFQLEEVPDTGELRADLLALFGILRTLLAEDALKHLTGVLVAMRQDPELWQAVEDQISARWEEAVREIFARAVARGEVEERDEGFLELFAMTGPSVVALRYLTGEGPIDEDYVRRLVDLILLPVVTAG